MSADGKSLYVSRFGENLPRKIYRYEISSGTVAFVENIGPPDLTGVPIVGSPFFSADGKSYVYSYSRLISQLYTVTGLK